MAAALALVTNYATAQIPEFFQDQWRVWLTFVVLVLLVAVLQLMANREKSAEPAGPDRVWNVPGRNPNFTGRDKDLKALQRLLKTRSRVAVHAVRGMGGVGKTQLALEFCHRHCTRLEAVWWFEAENPTLLPDQFRTLGRMLGLELVSDATETVQIVLARLRGLKNWLLIFDNAESAADLHPFLPSDTGRVLITTRRAGFDAIGGLLDLDTMARQESTKLLARRAPRLTPAEADELAELLGDLPLGLEQAAAYLAQSQIPAQEYLTLLRTAPDTLSDKGVDGLRRTSDRSLAKLWTLSLQRLDERHPAAAQLLAICAYMAPEAIPLTLFTTGSDALPALLGEEVANAASLSHIVGVLADYSLVKRDSGTITVHRLVQLAVRGHAADSNPETSQFPRMWSVALLHARLPGSVRDNPDAWPVWRQLLPHVLAVLHHQPTIPDLVPQSTSWLLDRTAAYLQTTGLISQARPLLERALAIDETMHGPDSYNVAITVGNLGSVLKELGQPAAAVPLMERALAIVEDGDGSDHADVTALLGNLALSLEDLGRSAEARGLLERALAISEASLGPDAPATGIQLNNLASNLNSLGHHDEARRLLERALTIDQAAYGPDHPNIAIRLNNLGTVLRELGRSDEARPLLERALAIDEAVYGPDHPTIAIRLNGLGLVLRQIGRFADALPLLERALTISEAVYGPDHPNIAIRLNNLALLLNDLDRAAEAKPLFERAIAIDEAAFAPDHPRVAISVDNLGDALNRLGRDADAAAMYERAARIKAAQPRGECD
ncbi:ATP-binding protein [Lentzea sp. NBRC 102530]|nr:ATP-binding protein [Lentzea sp. NBRC 102530]